MMFINNEGHLIAEYQKGEEMAKVDLGLVVPQFNVTATTLEPNMSATAKATNQNGSVSLVLGIPKGNAGENGISPTFSILANGHLQADYDNPYEP